MSIVNWIFHLREIIIRFCRRGGGEVFILHLKNYGVWRKFFWKRRGLQIESKNEFEMSKGHTK